MGGVPSPRIRRRLGGFTVLELLVSAAITALLAGFIVTIVSNVSSFWTRTSGRLSAEAQARLVLDQLSLDLSSALYRDDGNVWMAADILNNATGGATGLWQAAAANAKPGGTGATSSLILNSANIADARFGVGGAWLRFFTTKRGNNTNNAPDTFSAPVAVGYQIIRRFSGTSTASTKTAYLLHRAQARSSTVTPPASPTTPNPQPRPGVIDVGYNITAAAYTTSTSALNNGTITGDPRSIQVPGSRTNLDAVIAENVVDFGIRCYVRDATQPTGLRLVFPAANETGALGTAATVRLRAALPSNAAATSTNYNTIFPDVVDVMVRILTDEGARLIGTYEQANSSLTPPTGLNAAQYWWQLANANSQVFTRRIIVTAQSP